jgi:hypothetical protein
VEGGAKSCNDCFGNLWRLGRASLAQVARSHLSAVLLFVSTAVFVSYLFNLVAHQVLSCLGRGVVLVCACMGLGGWWWARALAGLAGLAEVVVGGGSRTAKEWALYVGSKPAPVPASSQ